MSASYRILALGGGGVKGFLHAGAIQELEHQFGSLQRQFSRGVQGCSVGSVFATGIAFGMNSSQITRIAQQFLKIPMGKPDFKMAMESVTEKGFFPMDAFEETMIQGFETEGIDLRSKVLGDGKIPLQIIASNLTKGIPTLFHGNVPVLTALKASCCIPLLFRPQVVQGQVYVDGGVLGNRLAPILLKQHRKDALILNLMTPHHHIFPHELKEMSPMDQMQRIYKTLQTYEHVLCDHPHKIGLEYAGITSVSELTEEQKQDMILTGRSLVRNYLRSQRIP